MNSEGRLLCPMCRKEHQDGEVKPGITLCVPCGECKKIIQENDEPITRYPGFASDFEYYRKKCSDFERMSALLTMKGGNE